MENKIFRKLEIKDYESNYFALLRQLTSCNDDRIKFNDFSSFIHSLNNLHQIWVIEDIITNKIICTGTLFIEQKIIHDMGKVGHIEDIVVDSNNRNEGIGKEMILHLKKEAEKENCYKIILNCNEHNEGFYKRCGLNKKGIQMSLYL